MLPGRCRRLHNSDDDVDNAVLVTQDAAWKQVQYHVIPEGTAAPIFQEYLLHEVDESPSRRLALLLTGLLILEQRANRHL